MKTTAKRQKILEGGREAVQRKKNQLLIKLEMKFENAHGKLHFAKIADREPPNSHWHLE